MSNVFILSTMRAGSTLLKAMLAQSPDVSHVPEVNMNHYPNLVDVVDEASSTTDKDILVIKCPNWWNMNHYPVFNLNAHKTIVVYRDCYDSICSMRGMIEATGDTVVTNTDDYLINYWCDTYEKIFNGVNSLDLTKTKFVSYESLLLDPKGISKELFKFIGAEATEGVDSYEAPDSFEWAWNTDDGGDVIKTCTIAKKKIYPEYHNLRSSIRNSQRVSDIMQRLRLHSIDYRDQGVRPEFYFDPFLNKKVNLANDLSKPRLDGVSGFMRVKNEEYSIGRVIESVIATIDELVIVYNDCTDNTANIIEDHRRAYPTKIKVFEYAPEVYPQGSKKHTELPPDSKHSLVNYYNFALTKTSRKVAVKIDGDDLFAKERFRDAVDNIRKNGLNDEFLMFYGINLWDESGEIFVNENKPIMGIGDRGFFNVSEHTYHSWNMNYETFHHPYNRRELGVLFYHLKGMKKDRGLGNYDFTDNKSTYYNKITNWYSTPKLLTWEEFKRKSLLVIGLSPPHELQIPQFDRSSNEFI